MDLKKFLIGTMALASSYIPLQADSMDDLRKALSPSLISTVRQKRDLELRKAVEELIQEKKAKEAGSVYARNLIQQLGHEYQPVRNHAQSLLEDLILRKDDLGNTIRSQMNNEKENKDWEIRCRVKSIFDLEKTILSMNKDDQKTLLSIVKPGKIRSYVNDYLWINCLFDSTSLHDYWGSKELLFANKEKLFNAMETLCPLSKTLIINYAKRLNEYFVDIFPIPTRETPKVFQFWEEKLLNIIKKSEICSVAGNDAFDQLVSVNSSRVVEAYFSLIDSVPEGQLESFYTSSFFSLAEPLLKLGHRKVLVSELYDRSLSRKKSSDQVYLIDLAEDIKKWRIYEEKDDGGCKG